MRIRVLPEVAPPIFRQSRNYYYNNCYRLKNISIFRRNLSISASSIPGGPIESPLKKKVDGEVRVRFAPSPTGNLHVGGARTALFNYLFARFLFKSLLLL